MYLLTAHLINGKKVGVEIPTYSLIKVPFKIETSISPGYADISSIENWWNFGRELSKDYLFVRGQIKSLIGKKGIDSAIATRSNPPMTRLNGDLYYIDPEDTATGSWAGYEGWMATWDSSEMEWVIEPTTFVGYRLLNNDEKLISAGYKIGSQSDHFADYGVPAISDYGLDYHKNSIECRRERLLRAAAELYNRIGSHSGTVLGDLINNPHGDLTSLYVEWGIKGSLEDFNVDFNPTPIPGILDYLYGRAPYDDLNPPYPKGLLLKTEIDPIDATDLAGFCDELNDILLNGNW